MIGVKPQVTSKKHQLPISFLNCTLPCDQTWKKARTRGHCLRKFVRIVEISELWKIDYSYFGIKLMTCENIKNIWHICSL